MRLTNALFITLIVAAIALSIPSVDAFGNELSYFGVNVRNSSNQLWNGQYTIGTIAYPSSSSGTVLFSTSSTVNITAGNFVVTFNNTNVDKNQTFWIATNISGTVYPRFQYTAAAQAVYADNASNAASGSSYNPAGIYANVSALQTFRDAVYVNVTILQGGAGTGNVSGGGLSGNFPLWNGTTSINRSGVFQNGTTVLIGSPDVDTGAGGQQILEISRNGPRSQITINDNIGANASVLHFRSGTLDYYLSLNSSSDLRILNDTIDAIVNFTSEGNIVSAGTYMTLRGNLVLTNASTIDFSQITGYNAALVNTTLLNATNSPTPGDCATAASNDQFTWASCGSGGGGNVTGSFNASGTLVMSTSTTGVANSSALITSLGDVYLGRNLFFRDYGSDQTIRFNGSTGAPGVDWIRSTNQLRIYGGTGGAGTIQMYGQTFDYNGHENVTLTLYSDSVNRTMRIDNTGNDELWLNLAPDGGKVGVNHTVTANSKALTVIGEMNVTSTMYVGNLVSCDTIDTDATGKFVCGTDSGGGGGGNATTTASSGVVSGTIAVFTSSTNIQNVTGANFSSLGDLYTPRDLILSGVNNPSNNIGILFFNSSGKGMSLLRSTDVLRLNFGSTNYGEISAESINWNNMNWTMYSDSVDTNAHFKNHGTFNASLGADNGIFTSQCSTTLWNGSVPNGRMEHRCYDNATGSYIHWRFNDSGTMKSRFDLLS